MTLRKKTLIGIGATFACLILMFFFIARAVILDNLSELEEQYTLQGIERALKALSESLSTMNAVALDWAARDDVYAFIQTGDEADIASTLADEAFTDARINFALLIDTSGRVVFEKGFELNTREERPVPDSLHELLAEDAPLLNHPDTESSVTGVLVLPESPLIVASRPILTSQRSGPIRGTLVVARWLDPAEVDRLAETTRLSLYLYRVDDERMPADFKETRSSLLADDSVLIRPLSSEIIVGYALLRDIYGDPALILSVNSPRDIYAQGQASIVYLMFLLLTGGLMLSLVTLLLADRTLLSRLAHLSAGLSAVAESRDLSTRVSAAGKDELAKLAGDVNAMLTALERAQRDLQESEQRFRDVSRTTGDWIWEMDSEGRYTYTSPVVEQILGYTPEEVIGRAYHDFFPSSERDALRARIQDSVRRGRPFVNLTIPHVHKNGDPVTLETSGLPLIDGEGNPAGYRGAHRDITATRGSEENLEAVRALGRELVLSRDRQQIAHATVDAVRLLFPCQMCGLWLVDETGRNLVCQVYSIGGREEHQEPLPLTNDKSIIATTAYSEGLVYVPDIRKAPQFTVIEPDILSELCVPLKMEQRVIGVISAGSEATDAFSENAWQLLSTLADQVALAVANARLYETVALQRGQLRDLTTQLSEAEEAERKRLARELHDQVGQNLTALGINLNIVQAQLPEGTAELAHSRLDDSLALLEQTTERIRGVMTDLRPPVLDDYGLVAALRWYGNRFTSRAGVEVLVQGEAFTPRLPPPVENMLFRITQEALNNVAKHAQATQVTVIAKEEEELVRLVIADDGVGFDADQVTSPDGRRGWGLLTMAERAEAMGGQLRIESRLWQGTRVIVEVAR